MVQLEKNALAYGVIAVLAYGAYLAVVAPQLASSPASEVGWIVPMLVSIGSAIVAGILVGIALGIASRRNTPSSDERDQRIARFGDRIGNTFVVAGSIAAIVLSMLRVDWFWIANAVYLAFVLSAVLSTIAKLAAYRRGMPTW